MTMNPSGGRRIKLNLDDFVHDGGSHRWMWLAEDSVTSVSDLVDKLRGEYHQLGPGDMVTVYLEDYILPPWETINILQSGDLVKVIRSRPGADKAAAQKSSQKSASLAKGSKRPSKVPQETSISGNNSKVSIPVTGVKRCRKVSSSSSSDSSDDSSESEDDNKKTNQQKQSLTKKSKVITPVNKTVPKPAESSSSSSSDSEDETPALKSVTTDHGPRVLTSDNGTPAVSSHVRDKSGKTSAAAVPADSSSDSSSSSSSDSEGEQTKLAEKPKTVPTAPQNKAKSSSSSDSSTDSSEEESCEQKESKVINTKHAADAKHEGNSVSKAKRKRKRKNKNKNKLPLDQIPVFDAEIGTSLNVRETKASNNNSHVRFDGKEDEDMEVENGEAASPEFTAEEVQKLYAKSVSSKPSSVSNGSSSPAVNGHGSASLISSRNPSANTSLNQSRQSTPKLSTNSSKNLSCEDVLLNQFDNKKMSNSEIVKKSNLIFRPRVLSVTEMKVKSTRKEPLKFSPGVGRKAAEEVVNQEEEKENKEAKTAEFSALLNCKGKVFDKDEEPVKDYTAYHLVSASGPRIGDLIAFKHVEMGANYTPEVSEYKEGKVVECEGTESVTFEMIKTRTVKRAGGKFEIEEESVHQEDKIQTFVWADLIEPRLMFP